MYVLLTGAKKNAGDFLIGHAAKRLLERFAPISSHVEFPAWESVHDKIDVINASKALILCGGPAYQSGLGTRIYPILDALDSITVPIISFGLGWKCLPGDDADVQTFDLPTSARPLLDRIRRDFPYAGCRDYLTWRILRRHHLDNAWMTGCPAWYDPDHFDHNLVVPARVANVVFTPAELPHFSEQSRALMAVCRKLFRDARIVCSFHRGWQSDAYTNPSRARNALKLKGVAERLGMEPHDISGGLAGIQKYGQFDLHVGYRVHAHLKMLSVRKPSFLIAEDSRGRGALEATCMPGVIGWQTPRWRHHLASERLPRTLRRVLRLIHRTPPMNPEASRLLSWIISEELATGFSRFQGGLATIDATRSRMLSLVRALPA